MMLQHVQVGTRKSVRTWEAVVGVLRMLSLGHAASRIAYRIIIGYYYCLILITRNSVALLNPLMNY